MSLQRKETQKSRVKKVPHDTEAGAGMIHPPSEEGRKTVATRSQDRGWTCLSLRAQVVGECPGTAGLANTCLADSQLPGWQRSVFLLF